MKSLNNNRMKMKTVTTCGIGILPIILSASAMLSSWQPLFATTAPTPQSKPRIEVCFVLDTTGSMGGLIEGAKQKIWSIANEMISAQPTPELKLGLIGYRDLCREAAKKDLIINTIQCGEMAETKSIWQEIAKLSEGSYVGISQSGNVAVISTPMDKELSRLNERIGTTLIPYGDSKLQAEVHAKYAVAKSAPISAMADRLTYNSKTGKAVQGRGELVDALNDKRLKLDEIDQKQLPAELQKLDRNELQKRITETRDERADLQKQIVEASKKREA